MRREALIFALSAFISIVFFGIMSVVGLFIFGFSWLALSRD